MCVGSSDTALFLQGCCSKSWPLIAQQRISAGRIFLTNAEAAPVGVLLQQQIVAISLPAVHSAGGRHRERFLECHIKLCVDLFPCSHNRQNLFGLGAAGGVFGNELNVGFVGYLMLGQLEILFQEE